MENLGEFIFDPTKSAFKSVLGAVEENQTVSFCALCAKSLGVDGVIFKCYSDDGQDVRLLAMSRQHYSDTHDKFSVSLTLKKGLYWYYFILRGVDNESLVGISPDKQPQFFFENVVAYQLCVYKRKYQPLKELNKGVMYHIFVDRFCSVGEVKPTADKFLVEWGKLPPWTDPDGNYRCRDFFGGNLKGIISKLDYVKSLGVNTIYLSPIFEAYSNNKYDTADYTKIDPMFGDEADFETLKAKAGELNIKIVLDGVFNHVGADSVYFDKYRRYKQNGAFKNENSPYHGWFNFYGKNSAKYESWWGFENLPRLNAHSKSLQNFLCGENGVIDKWSDNLGGWRLDVVDEIADDMLDKISSAVKRDQTRCVIGEVWEIASDKSDYGVRRRYFEGEQLDSVMDYPLSKAIVNFLTTENNAYLKAVTFDLLNNYPDNVRNNLMNVLSTHDTRRIVNSLAFDGDNLTREQQSKISLHGELLSHAQKLQKLAAVLQYTFFGFPSLFYGDEAGVQGERDPFCRACYPWGKENADLLKFYRKLGVIRAEQVFCDGDFNLLAVGQNAFAFSRENAKEKVVVAVNVGEKLSLALDGQYVDLLSGKTFDGAVELQTDSALIMIKSK